MFLAFHCAFSAFLLCLSVVRVAEGTVTEAVAIVNSKDGKVRGIFKFAQQSTESPIEIEGIVDGLTPGNHGYHIHQYGNLSNGCQSTGAHYNPKGSKHGAPNEPTRHAGDMGNIKVDSKGRGHLMIADFRTSLNGPNSIVGRAVVIHEKADDLGKGTNEESRKTGNAGGRIACGIIGVSQDAPVPSVAALDVDSVANTTQSPVEATTDANSTQSENKGTDNQ